MADLAARLYQGIVRLRRMLSSFPGTEAYWESRYARGADSGAGSERGLAEFKAQVINAFVAAHHVRSVIEFGCGDGRQLLLASYPEYHGFDVSPTAITRCRELFRADPARSFELMDNYHEQQAELALSLDVIYHLVEDDLYDAYMRRLFRAARNWVIVYSSDTDDNTGYVGTHVRHRRFTDWVSSHMRDWQLLRHVPNRYSQSRFNGPGSFADFYIYEKSDVAPEMDRLQPGAMSEGDR